MDPDGLGASLAGFGGVGNSLVVAIAHAMGSSQELSIFDDHLEHVLVAVLLGSRGGIGVEYENVHSGIISNRSAV